MKADKFEFILSVRNADATHTPNWRTQVHFKAGEGGKQDTWKSSSNQEQHEENKETKELTQINFSEKRSTVTE